MTVTPIPDLVLDVMHAADPVAQRAATEKLHALQNAGGGFAAAMEAQTERRGVTMQEKVEMRSIGAERPIEAAPAKDVYRKFEAFVLQIFVETMLPHDAEEVFGKGTAGNVWRSMLAEQLGHQLARGNGIGIARQLAAAHPVPAESRSGTDS